MKLSLLLIAFTGIFFSTNAQTINIQAGTTVSHLDWNLRGLGIHLYNQAIIGKSLHVGIDYLEKKCINLSSNIGLIRRGGLNEAQVLNEEGQVIFVANHKATLDYLTINTMIELKYAIKEKLFTFISLGPRIDFLTHHSIHFDYLVEQNQLSSMSYGILTGAGLKYNYLKSTIGIRFDYYIDFVNIATFSEPHRNDLTDVNARMFSLNVTYGYRF